MAIDQGTTVQEQLFLIVTGKIGSSQKEFPQYFPKSGWVEHNANEIWNSVQSVIAGHLLNQVSDQKQSPASGSLTSVKRQWFGTNDRPADRKCNRLAIPPIFTDR